MPRKNKHHPLTPDEAKNGWTRAALQAYLAERDAAVNKMHGFAGETKPKVVLVEGGDFDPHQW